MEKYRVANRLDKGKRVYFVEKYDTHTGRILDTLPKEHDGYADPKDAQRLRKVLADGVWRVLDDMEWHILRVDEDVYLCPFCCTEYFTIEGAEECLDSHLSWED